MPTSREVVVNKPLTGTELAEIMKQDVAKLLAGDGFYTSFIAYPRCAYEIRITLHMDNPVCPKQEAIATSRKAAVNHLPDRPELASLDSLPLPDASPESVLQSTEIHRDIPSPNAARVTHGLPIDVTIREQNGMTSEKKVLYPADYPVEEKDAPPVTSKDVTAEERSRLKMPPEKFPEVPGV